MRHAALSQTIRRVTSLENADDSPSAPDFCTLDNLSSQRGNVVRLECEAAKWIAGERVESCGDQDDVGNEAGCGRVDSATQCVHVLLGGQSRGHRKIPHIFVQTSVTHSAGAGIPRPLVHGHEMNRRIVFNKRLGTIAVMNVPVHNQDSLEPVYRLRIVRGNCDIAEQAESHRARFERVMSRRTDGAERSRARISGAVYSCKCATGAGSRGAPGAFARDSVGIEIAAADSGDLLNGTEILGAVHESDFLHRRVPAFELLDSVEQCGTISERACYGSQPANVLGMAPAGVVAPAVAVGNESNRRAAGR